MQWNPCSNPAAGVVARPQRLARLAVLALALLAGGASAQPQEALRIANRTVYAKDTPQWRQIREWLVQHASAIDGKRLGDPGQLGAVSVDYAVRLPAATRAVPRPLPLPATGTPGDSIAIESCAQGYLQSWHYVPDDRPQHRWSLQSYTLTLSAACPGGAIQG